MPAKTAQLQIRVTPEQKRTLKRLAANASIDLSAWILDRLLPNAEVRFQELVAALRKPDDRKFALAELADFLRPLSPGEFQRAVALAPRARLDPPTLNHLAGMIELAADRRGLQPPDWTRDVPIPALPAFGSSLASVRLHLLTTAPAALRRRNLFMDASLDDRV